MQCVCGVYKEKFVTVPDLEGRNPTKRVFGVGQRERSESWISFISRFTGFNTPDTQTDLQTLVQVQRYKLIESPNPKLRYSL